MQHAILVVLRAPLRDKETIIVPLLCGEGIFFNKVEQKSPQSNTPKEAAVKLWGLPPAVPSPGELEGGDGPSFLRSGWACGHRLMRGDRGREA